MSTLRLLLDRLIDYAGLFPPADLSMRAAVENYHRYLSDKYSWMLGQFIVPATRLREFETEFGELPHRPGDSSPWRLSALVASAGQTGQFHSDLQAIEEFNRRQIDRATSSRQPQAIIDTLEGKANDEREIADAAAQVPRELTMYLELPLGPRLEPLLDFVKSICATRPLMAKVRTGGIVVEAIPPAERIAAFIVGCAARDLGFKATAGLHHPIRASYRLTYRENSPYGTMFGFLNVFVAACAAFDDPTARDRIESILTETEAGQFRFDDTSLEWKGNAWPLEFLRHVRTRAVAFGSCSFEEPVDDLCRLKLLSADE